MKKIIIMLGTAILFGFTGPMSCYAFDMSSIEALAKDILEEEGNTEENVELPLESEEKIFSEGDFEYARLSDGMLSITRYNGNEENITIPAETRGIEVKELGENAFKDCTSLMTVEIPGSVKLIGAYCFKDCCNLQNVAIGNDDVDILENAFEGCIFQPDSSKYRIVPASSDGVDPDFKSMMDAYEDFFEEYVSFIETYDENDVSAMIEYTNMMTKYLETISKLEEIDEDELNAEELAYYIDTMARIEKMLVMTAYTVE